MAALALEMQRRNTSRPLACLCHTRFVTPCVLGARTRATSGRVSPVTQCLRASDLHDHSLVGSPPQLHVHMRSCTVWRIRQLPYPQAQEQGRKGILEFVDMRLLGGRMIQRPRSPLWRTVSFTTYMPMPRRFAFRLWRWGIWRRASQSSIDSNRRGRLLAGKVVEVVG